MSSVGAPANTLILLSYESEAGQRAPVPLTPCKRWGQSMCALPPNPLLLSSAQRWDSLIIQMAGAPD